MGLVPAIREFWAAGEPTIEQYLTIEEFTVLYQIQQWTASTDRPLGDLARRFLRTQPVGDGRVTAARGELAPSNAEWEAALLELVSKAGYDPPVAYCLTDRVKAKYNQPYFSENKADEQSIRNAIRVQVSGEARPVEISQLLERLKPLTREPVDRVRYYLPKELQQQALHLRAEWK